MPHDSLPPIGYSRRADRVRDRLADRSGPDGLAVTDLVNVRWLTGFTGSNGSVALLPDRLVLVTDGRYGERARAELDAAEVAADVVVEPTLARQHDAFVGLFEGLDRVGAEAKSLTHDRWTSLAADLPLVVADGHIAEERRTKDVGEIARIERACGFADAALAEVAPRLADRPTEADVRTELEYRMRLHGADGPSYDTIVASGPEHAARPHHSAGPREIVEGDTVVIDVGALVDGYHSDMTRSYVVGDASDQQREIYERLLDIQLAGLAAVAAGVPARDVDARCRTMAVIAGFEDWFLHSTGHGVGLVIHEEPFESPVATTDLRVGDVVTVEPGLYRVGFGGFRIEDLVEVTATGCRVLTATPKDTACLPSPPTT
jgi:Xaa-Pro aminopeptidase